MTSTRSVSIERTMCASSSAVGLSAQCRSSSSSTTGHDRDALASRRAGGLEQAEALALRVAADRLGEVREPPRELGNEPRELAPVRAELAAQHLRRHRRGVPAERLDERLIGDQRLLVTAAEEHRRALLMCGAGEFARQPRLADARIAGDQREPARPTRELPTTGPASQSKRVVAADERAAPWPRQRRREAAAAPRRRPTRERSRAVDGVEQAARLSRGRHVQLGP